MKTGQSTTRVKALFWAAASAETTPALSSVLPSQWVQLRMERVGEAAWPLAVSAACIERKKMKARVDAEKSSLSFARRLFNESSSLQCDAQTDGKCSFNVCGFKLMPQKRDLAPKHLTQSSLQEGWVWGDVHDLPGCEVNPCLRREAWGTWRC